MEYSDYMKLPFAELFDVVFTPDGQVRACGREACRAMIRRLEGLHDGAHEFGDTTYGRLAMPKAYEAARNWL